MIRFIQVVHVVKETHYIDTACMHLILLAGEWCLLNCYSIFFIVFSMIVS